MTLPMVHVHVATVLEIRLFKNIGVKISVLQWLLALSPT